MQQCMQQAQQMDMGMGWTRTLICGNISPPAFKTALHAIMGVKSVGQTWKKKTLALYAAASASTRTS